MIFKQYRLFCISENKYVSTWRNSTESPPNSCPNISTHQIDSNSIAVESIEDNILQKVVTQSELNDKTLKLCSAKSTTDISGYSEFFIKCPGIFNGTDGDASPPANGRYIYYGEAWFANPVQGDKVLGIHIIDKDNLLRLGLNAVIGSYTDDTMPVDNQGWFMVPNHATRVSAASGPGFIPSGMYIRVRVQKGPSAAKNVSNEYLPDTIFVNFKWSQFDTN